MHRPVCKLLATAALLTASLGAQAALTSYTDRAAFLAALHSYDVDDYDDMTIGDIYTSPLNGFSGSYFYELSTKGDIYVVGDAAPDAWVSTEDESELVLNNFDTGINAVGGYFFVTDTSGNSTTNEIHVSATDSDETLTLSNPTATPTTFFGFISTGTFSNLTLISQGPLSGFYATANDLILGTTTAPVPEPEGYALMLAGLAAVGAAARRRAAKR